MNNLTFLLHSRSFGTYFYIACPLNKCGKNISIFRQIICTRLQISSKSSVNLTTAITRVQTYC